MQQDLAPVNFLGITHVERNCHHCVNGMAALPESAQRGMGLNWPTSLELIRRSLDAARDIPDALVASGAGNDQLAPEDARSVDDAIAVYEEQIAAINRNAAKVDGVTVSLLDKDKEIAMRRQLGCRCEDVHWRRLQLRRTHRKR